MRQEDAASALHIDRSTVSKWEIGESLPRAEMLPKIAALYNCAIDELMGKETIVAQNAT